MKVTIDADDLPLNVSRETLQNTRFLKQLQRTLVRKALDLFARLAADEPDKFAELSKVYGNALRIGLIESKRDAPKLAKLLRFESTRSNYTSLEEYVAHRKEGQSQIYFMAGVGQPSDQLARSPFVEKLQARGYEVLLLDLPSDEPMMQALGSFMGLAVQDVAKKGLVFGDEDANKQEQAELDAHKIAFRPLTDWLKATFGALVADVVLTNRLVTSPCTIVVGKWTV
jgi:heat shock protein beta